MAFLFNHQTCQEIIAEVDGYYKPTSALCRSCALVDKLEAPGHVHSLGILSHPNSGAGPAGINGLFPLNRIIHLLPRSLILSLGVVPAARMFIICVLILKASPASRPWGRKY